MLGDDNLWVRERKAYLWEEWAGRIGNSLLNGTWTSVKWYSVKVNLD